MPPTFSAIVISSTPSISAFSVTRMFGFISTSSSSSSGGGDGSGGGGDDLPAFGWQFPRPKS
jgi:hypothetical protein